MIGSYAQLRTARSSAKVGNPYTAVTQPPPLPHAMEKPPRKSASAATDLFVKNLPAKPARYFEWLGDGLGVRVSPSGAKSFVYWYRVGTEKRLLTLGVYNPPHYTLKQARADHANARAMKLDGNDPVAQRQTDKLEQKHRILALAARAGELTFRDVFDRWTEVDLVAGIANGKPTGRKDGGAAIKAAFQRRVFPAIGHLPIRKIKKGDAMNILDATKKEGKVRTRQQLFSYLRQMFDFALDRDYIELNPMAGLKKGKIVGPPAKRNRTLADWEVRRLLARLPVVDLHVVTQLALRFLLATGQRADEVAGMPKAELDKSGALWTIPPERYKTSIEQLVPLSKYAQGILAAAAAHNTGSAFVFPSPQWNPEDDRHIDRHSLSRAVARKLGTATPQDEKPADSELGLPKFVPHDFRRTVRTGLSALKVSSEVAERVLGHLPGGIASVYDKYEYLDEKREALEAWGKKLKSMSR